MNDTSATLGDIELSRVPAIETCNPGFTPHEYNVVVAPVTKEEKTKGGIIMPQNTAQNEQDKCQVGRLVAISPLAFRDLGYPEGMSPPQVGDMVLFARFGGSVQHGLDGHEYRVCKDKDIMCVVNANG